MRAMWTGFITFGMVNIPTKLYSATVDHSIHFELFHEKDHSPIRYARICTEEEKEVSWDEIVKGFEYEEGNYILLTDEDFESAKVEYEKTVEILHFVNADEISPFFYERPYYLEPGKGGKKAYSLLLDALLESQKVGVTRFFLHNREHYGVLIPTDRVLVLNQIRLLEDIRETSSLNLEKAQTTEKEVEMAIELIERMASPFQPEMYHDVYKENLQQIIEKRAKGKKVKIKRGKEKEKTKVVDLMNVLKKSLESEKKKRKSA